MPSHPPSLLEARPSRVAAVLSGLRQALLNRWVERVRTDPAVPEAQSLSEPALLDHVPDLLDELVSALEGRRATHTPGELVGRRLGHGQSAEEHARERFHEGYSLIAALREISHLRAAVLEVCAASGVALTGETALLIHATLDETMGAVAAEIARHEQAARERAAREAREALALLGAFLSRAPVGFGVLDRDLRYVRVNKQLATFNGRTEREHLGHTVTEVLPEAGEALAPVLRQVFATGEPALGLEVACASPARPGEPRRFLASFFPILSPEGAVELVGGVITDVTEQLRATERLHHEAAFRERFLGIVGHDLRTPLTAIKLHADAQLRHPLPAGPARAFQRISTAAGRMARMVSDLLDFARSREGGIPVAPRPARLDEVCRAVLTELEATHPDRTIEHVVRGDCEGAWDPDRVAQVVSNLVHNALDYSPPESAVRVDLDGRGDRVSLAVHNEGPPIPPEARATLFDPYRRGTDGAPRSGAGLGLGLYIAHEIVRAHGGVIAVKSDDDGTTFTVTLPRTAAG